jgi:hypothetical protein
MAKKKKVLRRRKRVQTVPKAKSKVRKKRAVGTRGKNPGLKSRNFSKVKQQHFDLDYVDQLDDKSAAWMSNFMEEWLGANLNHPGKKFHKSKKDRKKCYDMNNQKQRDIYNYLTMHGTIRDIGDKEVIKEFEKKTPLDYEDMLIEALDKKRLVGK